MTRRVKTIGVSVSDLKSQLRHYLRVARDGEVQILDRGVPIARLTALPSVSAADTTQHRERSVHEGVARPGSGDASEILSRPPLDLPVSVLEALEEERADRL